MGIKDVLGPKVLSMPHFNSSKMCESCVKVNVASAMSRRKSAYPDTVRSRQNDQNLQSEDAFLRRRRKRGGLALRATGRAMAMCSLTTMLGFGPLATARYQALSAMGWVTIVGTGFC